MPYPQYPYPIFQFQVLHYLFMAIHYILHPICYLKCLCLYLQCIHLRRFYFLYLFNQLIYFFHLYLCYPHHFVYFICLFYPCGICSFFKVVDFRFLVNIFFIRYLVVVFVDFFVFYPILLFYHK